MYNPQFICIPIILPGFLCETIARVRLFLARLSVHVTSAYLATLFIYVRYHATTTIIMLTTHLGES